MIRSEMFHLCVHGSAVIIISVENYENLTLRTWFNHTCCTNNNLIKITGRWLLDLNKIVIDNTLRSNVILYGVMPGNHSFILNHPFMERKKNILTKRTIVHCVCLILLPSKFGKGL